MKSFRSKPVGWRGESHRHYLAAKGIKTRYDAFKGFPDQKSPEMKEFLDQMSQQTFGRSRTEAIKKGECVQCGGPAKSFSTELAAKEFGISGLCDHCQKAVFTPPPVLNEMPDKPPVAVRRGDELVIEHDAYEEYKKGFEKLSAEEKREMLEDALEEFEMHKAAKKRGDKFFAAKKVKEGVYETEYGNAAVVAYGEDGRLYAYDLDAGQKVFLGMVTQKYIRDLDPGEGELVDEDREKFYAKKDELAQQRRDEDRAFLDAKMREADLDPNKIIGIFRDEDLFDDAYYKRIEEMAERKK